MKAFETVLQWAGNGIALFALVGYAVAWDKPEAFSGVFCSSFVLFGLFTIALVAFNVAKSRSGA